MKRRTFLKKTIYSGASLGVLAGLYSWQIEPFWLEFVRVKMAIKNLPDHLVGKTLLQISDVHVGTKFDYQYIIDSFKEAQKLDPDFVVYTGDFVNYENAEQLSQLEEVVPYFVKGKQATVGVLGNHDYGLEWSNLVVAKNITSLLNKAGVTILSNEKIDCNGLKIFGLDDYWSPNFNPKKALQGFNSLEANIALCHNPDVCDLKVWNGYNSWILAGHTHGGQCKPPFLPAPILPVENKRYSQGEIDLYDGRTLYINRALGHLYQVRFNVRPEITIFTLEKA